MLKNIIWYTVTTISIIGIIILSIGFYKAISLTSGANTSTQISNDTIDNQESNDPTVKTSNSIILTIVGDSVAKGTGDETGKGFAGNISNIMNSKTSKEVKIENLGIDGFRSSNLLEQIKTGKLDSLLKTSDFILISIGGNDLRTIQNEDDSSRQAGFDTLKSQYISDLKDIIKLIRENNKNAYIVFVGLYNPYIASESFIDGELLRNWNYTTQQLLETDDSSIFVTTYDLIKFNTAKYIAMDGLHPNAAGYQSISSRIVDSIESLIVNK